VISNQESLSNSKLFLLFAEIKKGYSKRNFRASPIFIKHLGIVERSYFDYRYQEFYEHAVKQGIPTEDEALKQCVLEQFWTDDDEKEIKKLKDYIERLNQNIRTLNSQNQEFSIENQNYRNEIFFLTLLKLVTNLFFKRQQLDK
jgi:hypothetical protein